MKGAIYVLGINSSTQHPVTSALLNGVLTTLNILLPIPQGWPTQVLLIAANVPLYTLTPRFVMNVRELYVRDTQGRWNRDIDTGFGLSSGVRCDVGVSTTIGTIAFAEGGATRTLEDREMVMMEERVENSGTQVIG